MPFVEKAMKFYIGLSTMKKIFWICRVQYGSYQPHVTTDLWNTVIVTEKLNFKFYLILTTLNLNSNQFSQFSRSVVSNPLGPHGLQHARPPCPSPTPGVYSNSCPLSRWCHPTISSPVVPFSSCPQSLPASGSFSMSQFFASGGQSIGVSASASVLPINTQDWFPLEWMVGSPCCPRDSHINSNMWLETTVPHNTVGLEKKSKLVMVVSDLWREN